MSPATPHRSTATYSIFSQAPPSILIGLYTLMPDKRVTGAAFSWALSVKHANRSPEVHAALCATIGGAVFARGFEMNMKTNLKIIDVAVGVLVNPAGEVLFGQRPAGKPMAGFWEFPGGKVEADETIHAALKRELHEEIGVTIGASTHWRIVEHVYPHAHVRLHFQIVYDWTGEMHGRENQALHWQKLMLNAQNRVDTPNTEPVLPATIPLLADLAVFFQT